MSIEATLALFAVIGSVLGTMASVVAAIALWLLSGIKNDIHQIREYTNRRIERSEDRIDDLWADRTNTDFKARQGVK